MSADLTIEQKLQAYFKPDDLEWRISRAGKKKDGSVWAKCLVYVTARAIQDRLDSVFGAFGWSVDFKIDNQSRTVLCIISVRHGDQWVVKMDGSEMTDFEPFKGGISGAMKRAGVQWGIGRYLYQLEETFADVYDDKDRPNHAKFATTKLDDGSKISFYWTPPKLPAWAVPKTGSDSKGKINPTTEKPKDPRDWDRIARAMKQNNVSKEEVAEIVFNSFGIDGDYAKTMTVSQVEELAKILEQE